jgi:hypothetical protein
MKTLRILVAVACLAGSSLYARVDDNAAETAAPAASADNASEAVVSAAEQSFSEFVKRTFQDVYGRTPSRSELSIRVEDLKTGDTTFPQVAAKLFDSPEFHDNASFLVKLYLAVLKREPDYNQWAQILKVMRSGGATQNDALTAFLSTPDFAAAFPDAMGNGEFVSRLFQQTLERAPEAAELDMWTAKLDQGAPRRDVVEGLLRNPEFDTHVANHVNASLVYMVFLHRAGDAADISRMADSFKSGSTLGDAIGSIFQLPDYAARF